MSISESSLRHRAQLNQAIRRFFEARGVLEVETPLLYPYGVSAPYIDSLEVWDETGRRKGFLQTSPEYAMKCLLAELPVDVYQLCKAFRGKESSVRHNPEFTILEWYRIGWSLDALMEEVQMLLGKLLGVTTSRVVSYRRLFLEHLGVDPLTAELEALRRLAEKRQLDTVWLQTHSGLRGDPTVWLDYLFTECIQPELDPASTVFVHDFPARQGALAVLHLDERGAQVAKRFEVFYGGYELGNGYEELLDPVEQRIRFENDNEDRRRLGKPIMEPDERLLKALEKGLPPLSGVALGVDRLLMLQQGYRCIQEVLIPA